MSQITGDEDGVQRPRPEDEEDVARLVHLAGRRPAMPEHLRGRLKRATHAAWQAKTRSYAAARNRRLGRLLAAAALLLAGGGLALVWQRLEIGDASPSRPGGRLDDRVVATVERWYGAGSGTGLSAGSVLAAGNEIVTGEHERAALRLAGGQSLRLDEHTRLRLRSAAELVLAQGAVYLDSGRRAGEAPTHLGVTTPYGVARDAGTQFEVRLAASDLELRVREGEVRLEGREEVHTVTAGTALTIRADGTVEQREIAPYGPTWQWVVDSAPPFEVEGRTVADFLAWVSRETGWRLEIADPELERELEEIVVHGSVAGLSPDQTPALVLPTSGLAYRIEDGTMWIERAPGP